MSKVTLLMPKSTPMELPLVTTKVPAGFPSPAEEYLGDSLDLNNYLIKNPSTTFFARVEGDSMVGTGIMAGDVLVIDRSLEPRHGDVVVAILNGELTVKTLHTKHNVKLVSENPEYPDISINGDMELRVWGVATHTIGHLRS